ncbi:hypothetical protein RHMOL_Rhmol05G0158500 [Rhododendron molle]|uniref:Uncharacterized protein n=1 Tax=Rhododendron molle TaxID=49168 RepID=A0ACC0NQP7_RHOML|nr:hypothetical protein RHMOL_Rhmol05G0158500 [Rhododendron molle]
MTARCADSQSIPKITSKSAMSITLRSQRDPAPVPRSIVQRCALQCLARWPQLIALLWCADWNAPTLLNYEPTYAEFAHHKDKSKMVRKTVDLATIAVEVLQMQYLAQDQPEQIPVEELE